MQQNSPKIIGLIVIALLAVGGTGYAIVANKQQDNTSTTQTESTQAPASATDTATTTSQTSSTYKDGTYDASGSYNSPGGKQSIDVKLTLKDGTITSVSVTSNGSGESAEYQSMFKSGVSNLTVGKKVDTVKLSRVSGSSLTSTGFNNALEDIKSQARA